jgi:glycosyltransferase involved in cell wall biosynthesis
VFLEAMAAGKPIVAVRAAAVPEVVRNGILAEPQNSESLTAGIVQLYRNPDLCRSLASAGLADVENYDVHRVARLFLSEVAKVVPTMHMVSSDLAADECLGSASIQHSNEVLYGGR